MESIYSSGLLSVELGVWRCTDGAVVVYCVAASFMVGDGFVARVWVGRYDVLVYWLEDYV
jgi:hypothetical protein